jgi:nicotinamide-nucleotide amidase
MLYNDEVIDSIRDILMNKKATIAVAESVTSGHLQAALSSGKDASKFYQGGLTAYNAGQKCRHLNIEPIAALDNDCVTEQVACEMAVQVTDLFISDYGIAITGYANTVPEKNINSLHAFFAISHRKEILLVKKISTSEVGVSAQVDYANKVLQEFRDVIRAA